MSESSGRDLAVGLFVAVGMLAVAYLSVTIGSLSFDLGPRRIVYASFDDIGGLKPRSVDVLRRR